MPLIVASSLETRSGQAKPPTDGGLGARTTLPLATFKARGVVRLLGTQTVVTSEGSTNPTSRCNGQKHKNISPNTATERKR